MNDPSTQADKQQLVQFDHSFSHNNSMQLACWKRGNLYLYNYLTSLESQLEYEQLSLIKEGNFNGFSLRTLPDIGRTKCGCLASQLANIDLFFFFFFFYYWHRLSFVLQKTYGATVAQLCKVVFPSGIISEYYCK